MGHRQVTSWICAMLLALLPLGTLAAPPLAAPGGEPERSFDTTLAEAEAQLPVAQDTELKTLLQQAMAIKNQALECIELKQRQLAGAESERESLGPAVEGEVPEMVAQRKAVGEQLAAVQRELSHCRVLSVRSQKLIDGIVARQQSALFDRLRAKDVSLIALALEAARKADVLLIDLTHASIRLLDPRQLDLGGWVLSAAAGLIAWLLGFALRRGMRAERLPLPLRSGPSGRVLGALFAALGRHLPLLLSSAAAAAVVTLNTAVSAPRPFVASLLYGLTLYKAAVTVMDVFIGPDPAQRLAAQLDDETLRRLARRLRALALLAALGLILFSEPVAGGVPQVLLLLTRSVFALLLLINLLAVLTLWQQKIAVPAGKTLYRLARLALLAALIAEWTGYRQLAAFVLGGALLTMLLLGVTTALVSGISQLLTGIDTGHSGWQRRIHLTLGAAEGERIPGLSWLRIFAVVLLWGTSGLLLLRIWGMSDSGLALAVSYFTEGFTLATIHIVPARILMALLTFFLALTAADWLRRRLDERWLADTPLDRGTRESMATLSGYVVLGLAFVIALSVAGLDMSNLALIAGALSVGIGFGLQNIVNNFVSGVILLFERPIRTGDWVVVGGTEGFVKKISIRSTQLETFDRADIIVPNSEMISNQVTNWMLHDPWGRVIVPVGVAYGSDTALVKQLLLDIAYAHPEVITDGRVSEPNVLFMAFGESSLDFELRCFLRRIDKRLQVRSDLNFAIDAAFRAHGIEIPFPQRDLHLRSWDRNAAPPAGLAGEAPADRPV